jgi:hypothetical protein
MIDSHISHLTFAPKIRNENNAAMGGAQFLRYAQPRTRSTGRPLFKEVNLPKFILVGLQGDVLSQCHAL